MKHLMNPTTGWASIEGNTTGGIEGPKIKVSSLEELQAAATGDEPAVLLVEGQLKAGEITMGANKTITGMPGAEIHGHIHIKQTRNIVLHNLKIVGYSKNGDWSLDPWCIPEVGCFSGHNAVTITDGSHHICIDHCDISDGTNKNMTITRGSNLVTISWTKFGYSTLRPDCTQSHGPRATGHRGHRFCLLIGHSDDNGAQDTERLKTTIHHCWWGGNISQRMPRVRFGQVHLFNNLYTSTGCDYCIGLGASGDLLVEGNAFVGVTNPVDVDTFSSPSSRLRLRDNIFRSTMGRQPSGKNPGEAFDPSSHYPYHLEPPSQAERQVRSQCGPSL